MSPLETVALVVALVWLVTEVLVPIATAIAEDRRQRRKKT